MPRPAAGSGLSHVRANLLLQTAQALRALGLRLDHVMLQAYGCSGARSVPAITTTVRALAGRCSTTTAACRCSGRLPARPTCWRKGLGRTRRRCEASDCVSYQSELVRSQLPIWHWAMACSGRQCEIMRTAKQQFQCQLLFASCALVSALVDLREAHGRSLNTQAAKIVKYGKTIANTFWVEHASTAHGFMYRCAGLPLGLGRTERPRLNA